MCDDGERHDDEVGGCVPEDPKPFQLIDVGDQKWFWDPDAEKWVKPAKASGGDTTRKWDDVVYSRIDRDFL